VDIRFKGCKKFLKFLEIPFFLEIPLLFPKLLEIPENSCKIPEIAKNFRKFLKVPKIPRDS
jgi:hypothetical protein